MKLARAGGGCAPRGRLRLRLYVPDDVRVRRVVVRVGDRRSRTLGHRAIERAIVVRGLARRRTQVRLTVVAVEGRRTFVGHYRRCG